MMTNFPEMLQRHKKPEETGCRFQMYVIIIITLLSIHRVEIHFALWRLHKNIIFKSRSNAKNAIFKSHNNAKCTCTKPSVRDR